MAEGSPGAPSTARARFSWALFDWAAQPYFTLITTFVFSPYFATVYIGDAVEGQAIWGYGQAAAGFAIALLAPVFGSIADQTGRRKPWVAGFALCLVLGCWLLWYAVPDVGLGVIAVLTALVLAQLGAEFATVFTNAMLPGLALPGRIGRLGGFGWAMGYAGGLISLVIVLGLFAVVPGTGRTLLGLEPLAFSDIEHAGARLSGPFTSIWFVIFVIPLFLFTPRETAPSQPVGHAVRSGLNGLRETLRHAIKEPNIIRFLVARMIYFDGLTALFAFGGIYAAGVFGWTTTTLGIFGILLSVFAAVGALIGGPLDDRVGSKAVCLISVAALAFAALGALSIDRNHVLFVIPVEWQEGATGLFAQPAEKAYLACSVMIGIFAGPVQAASRTFLTRLAPPERITAYFGLYALSGKATAFLAPFAISIATVASGQQRAGLAVVVVFLVCGFFALLTVNERRAS